MFSLESPRCDSDEYTQHTIFNIKENHPKYPKYNNICSLAPDPFFASLFSFSFCKGYKSCTTYQKFFTSLPYLKRKGRFCSATDTKLGLKRQMKKKCKIHVAKKQKRLRPVYNICSYGIFNDILHMSFLAGTHVFKAFPAYTTTEI